MQTPKGLRRHIAILGRRNAGKSNLINALARQEVSITSPTPGTTTDPVEKTMELKPLGAVVLIDTAGVDDVGELGHDRARRSLEILRRADLAILATDADNWGDAEEDLRQRLDAANVPWLVARNKADSRILREQTQWRKDIHLSPAIAVIDVSAKRKTGIDAVVAALAQLAGAEEDRPLLSDLLPPGGLALLVVPLDSGAPKGRLILPQVLAIRDCLDARKLCFVCTEKDLPQALERAAPDLVVCDSQVVQIVDAATPARIPMTTFSILMARQKGDLAAFARGARALAALKPGDNVLIQEACSHHAQEDDIGRVKIPRLLCQKAGGELNFHFAQGKEIFDYEANADQKIKAIIHCGACVITRKQMLVRQEAARDIPMANYGMTISFCQGILERALSPFVKDMAQMEAQSAQRP